MIARAALALSLLAGCDVVFGLEGDGGGGGGDDEAIPDAGPVDGTIDNRWCSEIANAGAMFCEDFDAIDSLGDALDLADEDAPGVTYALDDGVTRTQPRSARIEVKASAGAPTPEGRLRAMVPIGSDRLRLRFSLFVADAVTPVRLATLSFEDRNAVLFSNGLFNIYRGQELLHTGSCGGAVPSATWVDATISTELALGRFRLQFVEGAACDVPLDGEAGAISQSVTITLGPHAPGPAVTGGWTVNYDNVALRALRTDEQI